MTAHRITPFDTDSSTIGIDNRASGCFSHISTDFVGPLQDSNKIVKGFGGTKTSAVKIGTLKWTWLDDTGKTWTHYIPNSFYLKEGGVRLLSPQHFAQQTGDIVGTGTTTNGKEVVLHWQQSAGKLTISLSPMDNVATFHLAPGFDTFNMYCHNATTEEHSSKAVLDNEPIHLLDLPHNSHSIRPWMPTRIHFDGDKSIQSSVHTESHSTTLEREYMQLHQSLGHIHLERMQLMVQQGTIPKRFQRCRLPFCASCAFGKSTRKPWRSHSSPNSDESHKPRKPGECVSVNQLISPTPGFIAQMSGTLTTQRYKCATIFVDQYSGFSYVWVQRTTSVQDTLKAKRAFENYASTNGIHIQH